MHRAHACADWRSPSDVRLSRAGADTPKVSVEMAVPSLTVPDGTVTQPIPDDRFRDPRFLEQGPMGCDQIGAEIVQLFAKFAQDAYVSFSPKKCKMLSEAFRLSHSSCLAVVTASESADDRDWCRDVGCCCCCLGFWGADFGAPTFIAGFVDALGPGWYVWPLFLSISKCVPAGHGVWRPRPDCRSRGGVV